jgi:beta-xylosidase
MKNTPAALLLALLLFPAGCSAPSTDAPPTTAPAAEVAVPTADVAPTNSPATEVVLPTDVVPATSVAVPTPAGNTFTNPVIRENFADPHLIEVDGTWYAYATNASSKNVPVSTSTDLVKWSISSDAMPALGSWVKPGNTWAPEVHRLASNFVLYYTARDKTSNKQCVGVATADTPEGKFRDASDKPLVCQVEEGGTIDASPFQDGDKLYLLYKNDGNCCGIPTHIYAQELAPDGLSLVGEPARLVRNDRAWEGRVVEAPTMLKRDGQYYLFFSANNYAGHEYAVGYARCESPMGPCEDAAENPILKSNLQKPPNLIIGPGHQTVITVDGQDWLVYHVWEVAGGGRRGDRRQMWMDRLDWENGKPVVRGPTVGPQPAP